jgi:hypothetical protein
MALYELAIMGAPSDAQINELKTHVSVVVEAFGLRLGNEVGWSVLPARFEPHQDTPSAAVFFGSAGVSEAGVLELLSRCIPTIPIASAAGKVHEEIPKQLRTLNCLFYGTDGALRIATALLECVGLLPRQRRVFVSYRRDGARNAALQLFNALSGRLFDVFLDTHGVAPADDFQAVLWHRLCDSDVLIMLDTPGYFESRWTAAEYGRALAKGISVLRIGWPTVSASPRAVTASRVDLATAEIDSATGTLANAAIDRICTHLEQVRGQGYAVRTLNLISNLKQAVERIGGSVTGVGVYGTVHVTLPDDKKIVLFPTVGVPTSLTLNHALDRASGQPTGVVYDHIGLDEKWLQHLSWLGKNIPAARWVKASEAAWAFAGWEVS